MCGDVNQISKGLWVYHRSPYTENDFFYINCRPSWIFTSLVIRKEILTNFIVFVIHQNIYLDVNFAYLW